MNTRRSEDIDAAATMLHGAETSGAAVDAIVPAPPDLATGYLVQESVHRRHGEPLVAWKAGVTSEAAQSFLGIAEPVAGRVRSSHVLRSPARIDTATFATAPQLEVEVGFRLLADVVGPRPHVDELAEIVDVVAAIEVVAGRVSTFPLLSPPDLVADNVVAGRIVVGSSLGLDSGSVRALDTVAVSLDIDGSTVADGTGAAAWGHPIAVLAWMAEHARHRGAPLRAGDLVITGTCTGMTPARSGSRHTARVGEAAVELEVR